MKIKYKKAKSITDKIMDAITEAEEGSVKVDGVHMKVDTVYLTAWEYDDFKASVDLPCARGGELMFYGVNIKLAPVHDLFHNGDFWVSYKFDMHFTTDRYHYTSPYLSLGGKSYRKVTP